MESKNGHYENVKALEDNYVLLKVNTLKGSDQVG
jgi:hypothetical protein